MAQSGSMTGSGSSPTFSSSQGESLYDSGDSINVLHYAGAPCLHSDRHCYAYTMSTQRGRGVDNFPSRQLQDGDQGPSGGHFQQPSQVRVHNFFEVTYFICYAIETVRRTLELMRRLLDAKDKFNVRFSVI